ncbi:hypothetical protein OAF56_04065 [Pirellulaceae bacterium]|nr:hypothetical protein [Pirellulaceae bacterium]
MKTIRKSSGMTFFVLKTGLTCCFLLLLNAVLVQMCCVVLRDFAPDIFSDPRVIQAALFFGPIMLIFIEFWIYDRRVDSRSRTAGTKN